MVQLASDLLIPLSYTGAQPELFQDRGGFVKLGHSDKHVVKNSTKNVPQGKILQFFLSSNINEVIRAVLNPSFFLQKDFARTKSTKSTKSMKRHKDTQAKAQNANK